MILNLSVDFRGRSLAQGTHLIRISLSNGLLWIAVVVGH